MNTQYNEYMRNYRNTPRGRINHIMKSQRYGSRIRGHAPPAYSIDELHTWANQNGYERLYAAWQKSGFQKDLAPSTDRKDNSKGYFFNNLRLVTWKENREQSYRDRRDNTLITSQNKKVFQLSLDGEFLAAFDSVESAARAVGGNAANILKVCQNRPSRVSAKGFKWCFAPR